jgi:DNA-binding NtrC family response regulator
VNNMGAAVGRVLVVDDDLDVREVIGRFMELRLNCEVVLSQSVDEALRHYDHEQFDVIVSDFHMPRSNGLDLANALSERQCEIPFLMYTAHSISPWELRKLHLVADVVQKPEIEDLLSIISGLMGWQLEPRAWKQSSGDAGLN